MAEITWPDSGELVRRINIRLWSDTPNAFAGVDQVVDEGVTCWAKKSPTSGVRYWGTKQIGEEATHLFWVRYQVRTPEQVTGEHVVEHDGRRYRVLRATNVGDAQRFTMIETKDLGVIPG
jgi:SPP1 family predicted phage head-tail adaptor